MSTLTPHNGLATKRFKNENIYTCNVSIPHGGLKTRVQMEVAFMTKTSPSLTVGLKLPKKLTGGVIMVTSPSLTVGLKHGKHRYLCHNTPQVSIPHGGLKTLQEHFSEVFITMPMSPSLTVGLKPQTYTQRKARNIKHFLRVAPLSSEGGLPEVAGPARLSVVLSNLNP